MEQQRGISRTRRVSDIGDPGEPERELRLVAPFTAPARRQPRPLDFRPADHLNVLIASLALGGAERIVQEVVAGCQARGASGRLLVLNETEPSHPVRSTEAFPVIRLGSLPRRQRLQAAALEVLSSPSRVLVTHLIRATDLEQLWHFGITTIPVVHNAREGWQDPPSAYSHPLVPLVVGCCELVARELREAGCPKPVMALRHELQYRPSPESLARHRQAVRQRHGIRGDTLLIGMIGQFKAQKAYTRAVRVLAEVRRHAPAKLMILGGWDSHHGHGRAALTATCARALEAGVMPDLLLPGPIHPVEPYLAAFDVFLQTSVYEGLSISLLEALQAACPVVVADAGGNAEVVPPGPSLIADGSDVPAYAEAIFQLVGAPRLVPPAPSKPSLIPRLWSMLACHGVPDLPAVETAHRGTLFLTSNLNMGGAQKSLVNLLTHLPASTRRFLCVLDQVYCEEYLTLIENVGVPILSTCGVASTLERVDRVLELVARFRLRTLCFWNVPAEVKLLVAKLVEARPLRLVDVSPGPMLFDELERAEGMRRRLSMESGQYLARLDAFVSKYAGGEPTARWGFPPSKLHVIPNGVPVGDGALPPASPLPLPAWADPGLAFGTCCRIAPMKRLEFLLEVAAIMAHRLPGATLTIVGGVDPRHEKYWQELAAKMAREGLRNVVFAGPHADVRPFLRAFKVFVMISDHQGCPNASLEAMAMGLPVVANPSGGTEEQVEHGVNGYIVSGEDPQDMAVHVELLLRRPRLASSLGQAGREVAARRFSMQAMVDRYSQILDDGWAPERRGLAALEEVGGDAYCHSSAGR